MPPPLAALKTPALLLDVTRMDANIATMASRAQALGVTLRRHGMPPIR